MNVIIVGSGGREHCLAWKIEQSPLVEKVFCITGNAGTVSLGENVSLPVKPPFAEIMDFAKSNSVELVVIGPEAPLVDGLADACIMAGIKVFGPSAEAARLEGSKNFAKEVMQRAGVPTAGSEIHSNFDEALSGLQARGVPIVIKADGLAAGKGVSIHHDLESAERRLKEIMVDKIFGDAGSNVLIEDFLVGPEASILGICDGTNFVTLLAAQDHKPVGEGDTGPNTGGMGSYCPAPLVTPEMQRDIEEQVFRPVLDTMRNAGTPFVGCLYAGLMITEDKGPMVLEFNCRFGDPETQSVLPLLKSDLVEVMLAACEGQISNVTLDWKSAAEFGGKGVGPASAMCVVIASGGYPGSYEKGKEISGLNKAENIPDVIVYHAGTKVEGEKILTSGGRVLGVTGLGATLQEARNRAYEAVDKITFEGAFHRRDIGFRAGVEKN